MIPYRVKYSTRVKRPKIEIKPREIVAVVPYGASVSDIEFFIQKHGDFIAEKQKYYQVAASIMVPVSYENCTELPVLGRTVVLPQSLFHVGKRECLVVKWLDTRLMEFLEEKLKKYAEKGLASTSVRLGSPSTRWGSCGKRGIMINRKLVHAPAEVTEYVLVHELVHLIHGNHSSHFWRKVEHHLGDVKAYRKWLNTQGAFLMNGEVPVID
jgi:predicted metal-dependent hydrolase